ncbi:biotin--[acetyl-CoA-carboxylase] ligase [Hoeflea sp. WL0058]|uniref:biotin--[biotin carboxyl-carrier protein] ligase n=1 Tax=Flavimaribacter sediminis TaxID=2865987 RepID=A0AAE3D0B9_9HYPH|nr:biotin--[acetyl-CoA-carboxylase] ligase [Flavimaribacter sediminis]
MKAEDYRHIALDDVQSTNTECLEKAQAGDPGNLWITARRQLGGRGRRGRPWVSEAGNLYASLLLIDPAPVHALASLPLVAALAVHGAIARALPDPESSLKIKWPNDVLLNGGKISGILLESGIVPDGRRAVVIGCGVNVAHAPKEAMYATATLRDAGAAVSAEELFAYLCQSMARELARWGEGANMSETRELWLRWATGVGKQITVNMPNASIEGIFRDIDDTGCLILEKPDGSLQSIAAGDLFFL